MKRQIRFRYGISRKHLQVIKIMCRTQICFHSSAAVCKMCCMNISSRVITCYLSKIDWMRQQMRSLWSIHLRHLVQKSYPWPSKEYNCNICNSSPSPHHNPKQFSVIAHWALRNMNIRLGLNVWRLQICFKAIGLETHPWISFGHGKSLILTLIITLWHLTQLSRTAASGNRLNWQQIIILGQNLVWLPMWDQLRIDSAWQWWHIPDSKVHGANMGPTWSCRPHVDPM